MKYDLIIVSKSGGGLNQVTQRCIDTAREDGADLNVIIVETGEDAVYNGADEYVKYTGQFCYNRALNMGLRKAKGDIHILANNDLIFHEGWSNIGELMRLNDYHSASLISGHQTMFQRGDLVYEGYVVGYILTGWCLFMDRYCHEKIGDLDESVSFWYSDNLYACQLEAAGIRHGLFTNYVIDHLASKTLNKQPSRLQRYYQNGEFNKFIKRKQYYAKRERVNAVHT
jgi:hypothetical protein